MKPRLLLLAAVLAGVTACALAAATPEDGDVQLYVPPAASPSYASTLASLPSATVARMPDTSDPEDAAGRTLVFRTPATQALPKVFAQRLDSDTTLAAALMALIQSRTGPPAAPAPEVPAFARPQPMTAALPAAPAPAVQPVQPAAAEAPERAPWLRGAQTGTGRSPARAAVAAAAAPSASAVPPEGLP